MMYGYFTSAAWAWPNRGSGEPAGSDDRDTRSETAQPSWNLHLACTGGNVPTRFLEYSPSMAVLAVEDVCWQIAAEDWKRRRPHRWQPRARAAWNAEGARLAAKAGRLRQMAEDVFREL